MPSLGAPGLGALCLKMRNEKGLEGFLRPTA